MRDKADTEDIDAVLAEVRRQWRNSPYQRLGQLLLNVCRDTNGETNKHILWNADEDELLRRLRAWDDSLKT